MALEQTADHILNNLNDYVIKTFPKVTQLALQSISVDAMCSLFIGFLFLILALILAVPVYKCYKNAVKQDKEHVEMYHYRVQSKWWVPFGFSTAFCIVFLLISSVGLLNLWNWVAVFHPELYWAHTHLT